MGDYNGFNQTKDLLSFSNTELLHSEEVLKKFGIKRFSNSDYYSSIANWERIS